MLFVNGVILVFGWVTLLFITLLSVIKRSKQGLIVKPMIWFLAFLLFFIFGGISLMEYLIFGGKGVTNRWTLAVLSDENIYLFSSLWFISAVCFTIAAMLSYNAFMRMTLTWNKAHVWSGYELDIAVHIALILAVSSAVYEGHFASLKGLERTAAMWMRYEKSFGVVNLPYKDIFFVYFTLLLMWVKTQTKKRRNFIKYFHILFIIVFMLFAVFKGSRLPVAEALLVWLAFNLWTGERIRFSTFVSYGVLTVGVAVAFYSLRGPLLSLFYDGMPFSSNFGRLSLLEADAGGQIYVTIKAYTEGWKLPFELMPGNSALFNALVGLIPRTINPIKTRTIVYLFNKTFCGLYTGGGFAMNIVADGIFNFGRQLFFVQAFLIGIIVGLFEHLRLSRRRFGPVLYVSCASIAIYSVIADLNQFLQVIIWRLITVFVVTALTEIFRLRHVRSAGSAGNRSDQGRSFSQLKSY